MSQPSNQSSEKENVSDGPRRVLEAQKSSQASSNRKGLQPGVANRVRVSSLHKAFFLCTSCAECFSHLAQGVERCIFVTFLYFLITSILTMLGKIEDTYKFLL